MPYGQAIQRYAFLAQPGRTYPSRSKDWL